MVVWCPFWDPEGSITQFSFMMLLGIGTLHLPGSLHILSGKRRLYESSDFSFFNLKTEIKRSKSFMGSACLKLCSGSHQKEGEEGESDRITPHASMTVALFYLLKKIY